ncbi:phage major capsid protein [Corynebacterium pseudodiphtheriticum]|uniref:phage major capsid protein n=1 Tax=Corynebacterium pseudodiphtheriticum TaxID=37637 RepID=UPI001EF6524E|nr:phage major capsid protein [Corynebacterium pseudodiphtheriticum]
MTTSTNSVDLGLDAPRHKVFNSDEIHALITLPLLNNSVAATTATVIRPTKGHAVEIPVITSDYTGTSGDYPGIVAEGGEVPIATAPKAEVLSIEHLKLAARAEIPWEQLNGANFPTIGIYGDSLTRRLMNTVDKGFLDESKTSPFSGLGTYKKQAHAIEGQLQNLDMFLDAIQHAQELEATITSFIMSPATLTKLAKLKRTDTSQEPLLGTADAPGTMTIAGVQLKASKWCADNVIWAVPQDRFYLSLREDVTLKFDEMADFNRMTSGLLAYMRVGMGSIQPEALSRISITE